MRSKLKLFITFFILLWLHIFLCSSYALSPGFVVAHENIFLEKNPNPYYPQVISSFAASFFLSHSFVFENVNLSLSPGFFIDSAYNIKKRELNKMSVFPFFNTFNLSFFTEHLSFSFAKDSISFGEGFFNLNDYYFLNIPIRRSTEPVYHLLFEFPVNQFSINIGAAVDTKALDHYKIPLWYSLWANGMFSNNIMTLGIESDVFFDISENKDTVLKLATEISFFLPLDFKIYTTGKLPISFYKNRITEWGIFVGIDKSFILESYNFTTLLGASYSAKGFGYSIFQNAGLNEFASITCGVKGENNEAFHFVFETEFFISTFKLKFSYVTRNFLKKDQMLGLLSIGASFNE